ncbi:UNVERIFIED_CONTAM: MBL fold metallo-hydrolase, partial [Bacteroidetes bacterium 56_B9]
LVNGRGGLFERARLVMHVLLLELPDRLVLVDTGLGANDVAHPELLPPQWVKNVAPRLDLRETVIAQIRALGLSPQAVRDIVLTHLDRDHAGG